MWRAILVGTLVLVLAPAVARETVCDRHTEGGRVLQTCQFVGPPAASPGARKDGDASEAPAPPAGTSSATATGASASSAPSATHAAAAILCATAAAAPTATVSDAASLLSAERILRTAGRRARLSQPRNRRIRISGANERGALVAPVDGGFLRRPPRRQSTNEDGVEDFGGCARQPPVHENGVGEAVVVAGPYPASAGIGSIAHLASADTHKLDRVL